ncbi:hypothetical protein [Mesorhizobium sp. M0296]
MKTDLSPSELTGQRRVLLGCDMGAMRRVFRNRVLAWWYWRRHARLVKKR